MWNLYIYLVDQETLMFFVWSKSTILNQKLLWKHQNYIFLGGELKTTLPFNSTIFQGEYFNVKDPMTATSILPGTEDSELLPQYGSFLMSNTGAYGGLVGTAPDVLKVICSLAKGLTHAEASKVCLLTKFPF